MSDIIENVKVYCISTKQITQIPADELAAGMVRVNREGIGEVWVKASDLGLDNPYRHDGFDPEIMDILRGIKAALDEVYPLSLEHWSDGFRKDSNPEREIAIWVVLSEKYQQYVGNAAPSFSLAQKKELFQVFLSCVNNGEKNALLAVSLAALSKTEAQQALKFFATPKPGS